MDTHAHEYYPKSWFLVCGNTYLSVCAGAMRRSRRSAPPAALSHLYTPIAAPQSEDKKIDLLVNTKIKLCFKT